MKLTQSLLIVTTVGLTSQNPHKLTAPLDFIINCFMTELSDRNFSQTEIRTAFEDAIKDMPRYASGEERRSSTSSELATADWRAAKKL